MNIYSIEGKRVGFNRFQMLYLAQGCDWNDGSYRKGWSLITYRFGKVGWEGSDCTEEPGLNWARLSYLDVDSDITEEQALELIRAGMPVTTDDRMFTRCVPKDYIFEVLGEKRQY